MCSAITCHLIVLYMVMSMTVHWEIYIFNGMIFLKQFESINRKVFNAYVEVCYGG